VKIPSVAIAAAFVGGIVLGLNTAVSHTVTSPRFLIGGFIAAGLTIPAACCSFGSIGSRLALEFRFYPGCARRT
jgi:hypothetical protein